MSSFDGIPDEIIVELIRNHIHYYQDVYHCYVLCKRFHRLVKNHCKDKLAGPYFWFWLSIEKMKQQENEGFASSIKSFMNCEIRIPWDQTAQPDLTTPKEDRPPKKSLFQKIKNAVTGSNKSSDVLIDKYISRNPKRPIFPKKVLLLGAGSQGKSTFCKQVSRILTGTLFSEEERKMSNSMIYGNTVNWLKNISSRVLQPTDELNKEIQSFSEIKTEASNHQRILQILEQFANNKEFLKVMEWSDSETALHRITNINNFLYLLKERQRIFHKDFICSNLDVLIARARTTGIIECEVACGEEKFTVIDNGGERSERRKWIHCFDGVHVLLYFISLADYDMVLYEDNKTNRMFENLALIAEVVPSKWFEMCPIITVFTHADIFKDKIRTIPISNYFPEYKGSNQYQEAFRFFADQCQVHYDKVKKPFYHITVTTIDTESVCNAWIGIMEELRKCNLPNSDVSSA